MKTLGAVIIIEDDTDDRDVLKEIFAKLQYDNEVLFFNDGAAALDYLNRTDARPFLILSDINMPRLDGKQLRAKMREHANIQLKCIPYLFITTAADRQFVIEAYSTSVQGFFKKPNTFDEMEDLIVSIMEYWTKCTAPQHT